MKKGNCLFFAIPDFLSHGGDLYIEFWKGRLIPHFSVQRDGIIYDYGGGHCGFKKEFWFDGEKRHFKEKDYQKFPCRRFVIAKRAVRA